MLDILTEVAWAPDIEIHFPLNIFMPPIDWGRQVRLSSIFGFGPAVFYNFFHTHCAGWSKLPCCTTHAPPACLRIEPPVAPSRGQVGDVSGFVAVATPCVVEAIPFANGQLAAPEYPTTPVIVTVGPDGFPRLCWSGCLAPSQ